MPFPRLVQMLQMLHHMPQRHHVKRFLLISAQSFRRIYFQPETLTRESPCLRTFLDGGYPPAALAHEVREIPCTRTDIQQASPAQPATSFYQMSLAPEHVLPYVVIQPVGKPFARIGMRNVIGRLVIASYLAFIGHVLRKKESARHTPANVERFICGVMVGAGHHLLETFVPAKRTCIYVQLVHSIP